MVTSAPRKSPAKTPVRPVAKAVVATTPATPKKPKQPGRVAAKKAATVSSVTVSSLKAKKIPAKSTAAAPAKPVMAASKSIGNRSVAKSTPPKALKDRTVEKVKKAKLVRDSFTMPEAEYAALGEVKKACLKAGFEVKKSELLRIGVALVRKLTLAALKQEVGVLAPLKAGRPRKEKVADK